MSDLITKIREQAIYKGPSKAERSIWNAGVEAAIKVVEANVNEKPQTVAPRTSTKTVKAGFETTPPKEE